MKLSKYLIPVLGILAIGCSENVDTPNSPLSPDNSEPTLKGYLAVSVAGSVSTFTRADGYVDGSSSENYVDKVRFYFFDNDGNPVKVRKNPNQDPNEQTSYYSYYDWDVTAADNANAGSNASGTVEKIISTTLTLTGPDDEDLPDDLLVLAIVNPTVEILSKSNLTLPAVRELIADYQSGLTTNNFVMSNSVFVDENNNVIDAKPFKTEDYVVSSIKDAKPLVIYVERVVSRLDLSIGLNPAENGFYDTSINFQPIDPEGVPDGTYKGEIFVKINGWAVTSTPNQSNLVKSIDATWGKDIFGDLNPWNSDDFNRSFWAINPLKVGQEPLQFMNWYSYNQIINNGLTVPTGTSSSTTYMQENANPYETAENSSAANPKYPSKVIMSGTLVDASGNPVTIAEYYQQYYTLDGLMNYIAGFLNMWTPKNSENGYDHIGVNDIKLVTMKNWVNQDDFTAPDVKGTYYVYFVLTPEAAEKTWYHKIENSDQYTKITDSKTYIFDSVGKAMVWTGGATYYYFDIEHLGAKGHAGYTGVVRNHIYDCTVLTLTGLGTPVFDPSETIYPEKPERNGNLLQAEIDILQWRIVRKTFDLEW